MIVRVTKHTEEPWRQVHVFLPDGTPVPKVTAVDIRIRPDELVTARLEVLIDKVDIIAEADVLVITMPDGKRYRLVELEGEAKKS